MVNRRKRDENRAVRRAFVYSKSMEFVVVKILQSSERTVIDWKFCSKRIKFLSTWNTFKRSSRVYAFDDMVLQQRENCNCQSPYIAFHPCFFPSFTFFPLDQMVQQNGRLKKYRWKVEKCQNVCCYESYATRYGADRNNTHYFICFTRVCQQSTRLNVCANSYSYLSIQSSYIRRQLKKICLRKRLKKNNVIKYCKMQLILVTSRTKVIRTFIIESTYLILPNGYLRRFEKKML